ncbi:MAG: sulfur carrier protein [Maribacter sp.]|jgi:sulfur carrier protein
MTMLVTINNQPIEVISKQSLKKVLLDNHYQQFQGIAVAINDVVIPKSLWDDTIILDNDNILVITATAGG